MAEKKYLAKISILISQKGLQANKDDLVHSFTRGRSTSRKDLTNQEAINFIAYLESGGSQEIMKAEVMKNKIISLAHEMQWELPGGKVDMNRVNGWCAKFGYLHKVLDDHVYKELPKLITQFEQGPYKDYLRRV